MRRWICVALLLGACGDDSTPAEDAGVDVVVDAGSDVAVAEDAAMPLPLDEGFCPGAEDCAAGEGALLVGAAMRDITPNLDEEDVQTVDVDGDGNFDPFDGDEFADRNGNGRFDGVWVAGFSNGRAANGVSDPQWVRAMAVRSGDTTIAIASIDCIGFFYDEVLEIREAVSDLEIDYLTVASTHTHEARDTMGLWGVEFIASGIDPDYNAFIREQAALAIRDAVAALEPANVQYADFRLRDMPGGVRRYVSDSRDPNIIDDEVRIMRFERESDASTLTTLVNWASHPQYIGSRNQLLSSDYVHWLREAVEDGVTGPEGEVEGVGGMTLFVNGAIGTQIGNERMNAETWAGEELPRSGFETAQTIGEQVGYLVLRALGEDGGSTTEDEAPLGFRYRQVVLDVENRRFHSALLFDLFPRSTFNWNETGTLIPGMNEPDIITEVAVLDIGRASMLLIPGELDPALFVGGYDGSFTPEGTPVVDTARENAPDLSGSPEGPYLRDLMREDASQRWVIGLANDQIGYFIPEFDFKLATSRPYVDEAPGAHYEETNSIGESGWPRIKQALEDVLAWTP
ncbi:MAG: hypothetical protein AAGE52_24260 [Myxococcota bacterium]